MTPIHNYNVVQGYDQLRVVNRINKMIAEGWQPLGAPTFLIAINPETCSPCVVMFQAMVKVK
jgi:hypothetical protein